MAASCMTKAFLGSSLAKAVPTQGKASQVKLLPAAMCSYLRFGTFTKALLSGIVRCFAVNRAEHI